jgi:hypothetical protein
MVTVAMAPQPAMGYAPPAMSAPPAQNLFTQPMQAPPMQPMQAPPMQPMQAPPMQPMQAPPMQPMQAPSTAMMLQAPGLLNSLLGTIGEHLARRRNPRVQMSPMPTLAQAPVANAPVAYAPVGQGQAYAAMTGYAPAGPPIAVMTPEETSFAPCNTFHAPCRFHRGPCPGPRDGWGGGGSSLAPPSGPSASPQNAGHGFFDWLHHK